MATFLKYLHGVGIIPAWAGIVPFLISLSEMLLFCVIGFIIIYFICKTLNKSLIDLNKLLDSEYTAWEKNFVNKLLWKYPLWGFVQQLAIITLFYFMNKIWAQQWLVIIVCSLIFGLLHFPNLYLFLATFGLEQMLLHYFVIYQNIYMVAFIHGFLGTCLMYFSPSIIYTKFSTWKNYWELYRK